MTHKHYRPWHPLTVRPDNEMPRNDLEIRKADCAALQALAAGIANEDQQKRALGAILHICGLHQPAWMPAEHGGERDSSFAAGKQHVGFQIRKLITHSLSILTGESNDRPAHDHRSGKPADERNACRAKP
ncbi:hypothetical protein [Hoeflea sp. 108]|uniref:hypothetical protein n=1 Tax=Hoeflea sp. 108 TaxID=1116369 RepID=UPI00058F9990|nr:hypothetical protein [Hoeflea sp. 108]